MYGVGRGRKDHLGTKTLLSGAGGYALTAYTETVLSTNNKEWNAVPQSRASLHLMGRILKAPSLFHH